MNIKEFIKSRKPTLTDSTINSYASRLRNLHRVLFGDEIINIDNFKDATPIVEHLKTILPTSAQAIASALFAITDDIQYQHFIALIRKSQKAVTDLQVQTPAQSANEVPQADIKSIFNDLKKNAMAIYKKKSLTLADLQSIQQFVLLALYHLIPPRRSKDFTDFKIKNINPAVDNYYDTQTNELVFNSYKTVKTYGEQRVKAPAPLKTILVKWIATTPSDYLISSLSGNKIESTQIGSRLNLIFGSKSGKSVNMLRHSFLTDKFEDSIAMNKTIAQTMTGMGTSIACATNYIQQKA